MDFVKTLLISCLPAIITALISYLGLAKKYKSQLKTLELNNKQEIDKLMNQHKIDLDSLNNAHILEMEKLEADHKNRIELIKLEHAHALEKSEKEQSNAAMYSVLGNLMTDPQKLTGIMNLMDDPRFKSKK